MPEHFDPDAVGRVWRVPYEERAAEAAAWADRHGLRPASSDERRVALVTVDVQNTFCIPGFELYVGGRSGNGAVDDNVRLCRFLYENLPRITRVFPTLDTHGAFQIFHAVFLVDDEGRHPAPYTEVTADDVASGRWRFNPDVGPALGHEPAYVQRHLAHYTAALEAGGKYALTVWPYHAMLGGIGHALVPAVEEAIFFHAIARSSPPSYQVKGSHPLTEHYSVFGPEVDVGPDGETLVSPNWELYDVLEGYDAVAIAGQAKSHCVAWTIDDLLRHVAERDPALAGKVVLLDDCSSPVVVPGTMDFTDQAEAAFARFRAAGMHVVPAATPVDDWPVWT